MFRIKFRQIAISVLAIVGVIGFQLQIPSHIESAAALANGQLFWNAQYGTNMQIWSASISSSLTKSAITPDSATNAPNRYIVSDGTYLYTYDSTRTSIVKRDTSGSYLNSVTSALPAAPEGMYYYNGDIYFTKYNDIPAGSAGVYVVSASGNATTPTQLINTSTPGGPTWMGFTGVAADANALYFIYNRGSGTDSEQGLYRAARISGNTFQDPVQNSDASNFRTAAPSALAVNAGNLYVMRSGGIWKTTDWNSAVSTWTLLDTSSQTSSLGGFSILGSDVYFTGQTGGIYSITTSGSGLTQLAAPTGTSAWSIASIAAPTYTITYQHGTGATGADLVQTISQGSSITLPSPVACPLSATDPCFTAPSGQRQNGWVDLSGGPTYYTTGQTITPASNLTLTARWTGGPIQYSTTSFLTTPNPMTSIAFPNTAVGGSNQITIYAYNSGTASTSISNETIAGSGVSRQGGTCNASGGTIAAGAQCTVILQWNPSSAGSLANGSYKMQVSGSYFDAVTLTGTAATPYTVTFNPNGGSGTMGNQTSAGPSNLNANTFTRAGYTFHYWTLFSDGSGSTFNNQASYPFSSNQTLFAQWTANSHTVTYDTGGGSAVAAGSFNTDGSMTLPGAPTKSGYTFNGWFTSPTGGTALSSPYSPGGTSNITLYAQWSVDSSNSSSGLPHTGTQVENQFGLAGLLFLSGFALLALAYFKRRKI